MNIITSESVLGRLSWGGAVEALRSGHLRPKAQVADIFLGPPEATLLSRGAFIEGLGYGVKSVTVFGRNAVQGLPTIQGAMSVFEPQHGRLIAVIDGPLVTEYKTAADSVLGARFLARPESEHLLIVGAGTVARSLIAAYSALFSSLRRVSVWSRRPDQAAALAREFVGGRIRVVEVSSLPDAAVEADIISTATLAREPVLHGAWIRPGTHVDLIGAYKSDMREADDELISTGSLFVDSRETTLGHIGELTIPIAKGVLSPEAVRGDLYDLVHVREIGRRSDGEITLYKNGGGAHLDLMISHWIAGTLEAPADPCLVR